MKAPAPPLTPRNLPEHIFFLRVRRREGSLEGSAHARSRGGAYRENGVLNNFISAFLDLATQTRQKNHMAADTTGEALEAGPMDLDDQSCASV